MGGNGDSGAEDAAWIQSQASREATAEARRQFAVTQENLKPLIDQLKPAVAEESALMGLSGADAERAALASFKESPGQQYLREKGEQALLRNASAVGGLGGGNVRTALQEQGMGFAQQALAERMDRLANIRSGGQSAVTSQGALGAQAASNIGSTLMQGAQAQASGILASSAQPSTGMKFLSGGLSGGMAGSSFGPYGAAAGAAIGGLAGLLS